jgi:hypothetical protein
MPEIKIKTSDDRVLTITAKDGLPGAAGKDGSNGIDGKNGDNGIQGIQGEQGVPGINGKDGRDGVDGKDGEKGDKGDKGDKGERGDDGKDVPQEVIIKLNKAIKDTESNLLWMNNGAVKSIIAGTNIAVTGDPQNPIISFTGSTGGVTSITALNNSVTITPITGAVTVSVPGALVHPTTGSTFEYSQVPVGLVGQHNTGLGVDALKALTTGLYNVAISQDALKSATDATSVIAIGFEAAKSVVTGASNSIVMGTSNASLATTLTTSTIIGTRLATSASGVASVIAVGDLMFQSITSSATSNLGIGFNLFNSITSDTSNYGIGKNIGDAATSTTATFSFGEDLLRNATGVSGAFAFGQNQFNNLAFASNLYGFGSSNMNGSGAGAFDSFLIGSGIANNGASFLDGVIAIGTSIAGANADPYLSSVVIIGKNAGLQGTSLVNEIYIGENAGSNSVDGTGNINIGAASGYGVVHGQNNIYIGYQNGYNYDGSGNVSLGLGTMGSWNGSYNVFSGTTAGNLGAGDYIVGVGYNSFNQTNTILRAMALGSYAGALYSTDVTDVVLIGYATEASSTTATNEIDFGSETSALTKMWLGWGGLASAAPASSTVTLQPTDTVGTNLAGANVIFNSGAGTGNGAVSSFAIKTPTIGTTGTTLQTLATRLTVDSARGAFTVPVGLNGYTVATLPAGAVGDVVYVTDQIGAVTAKGVAPVGGGAFVSVVFFNGAVWVGI